MPLVLTFGDSNTHGTPPIVDLEVYGRFAPALRWPVRAAAALGWDLVEEGLPGRTAQFADPVMGAHMNGQDGLKMALQSHGPIDVLVIMLDTNDVKAKFGASPEQITGGIAGLIDLAQEGAMQRRHGGFAILLVCPPPVLEQGPIAGQFYGARARSLALPPLYRDLARARGCGFLNAGGVITVSPVDGVHLDPEAHATLADAVVGAVRAL